MVYLIIEKPARFARFWLMTAVACINGVDNALVR